MQLSEYMTILRRYFVLLTACVLIAVGASALYTSIQQPVYSATARAFVSTASASSAYDLSQGGNYAQQIVASYADVATTPKILGPVRQELGLHRSIESIASGISASAAPDTVILDITVDDPSPVLAASIANSVLRHLSDLVPELTSSENAGAKVRVTTLANATPAVSPTSPSLPLNLGIGMVAGLAVAGFFVLLREALSTTLRTIEDAKRVTGLPILGQIPLNPHPRANKPVMMDVPVTGSRDSDSESYRTLRANVGYVDLATSSHLWVVTSSIPGEGKTSTVLNLGFALAQAGARVLVIDADLRRPKVADYCGIDGSLGLTDVILGGAVSEDAVQTLGQDGLAVLPAGGIPPNPSELLQSHASQQLFGSLAERFDYVLVDTPPVLAVADAAVLSGLASGVIVVCGVGCAKLPQLSEAIGELKQVNAALLGAVVTRVPRRGNPYLNYSAYGAVSNRRQNLG